MKFDVKRKLKELEGKTFYTVRGLPYTYEFVSENIIKPSRTNYNIHIENFEKALKINPTELYEINHLRGPSYIFGIITDKRFK